MAEQRYGQQFARNIKEVVRKVDGKETTVITFRGVIKYREENPDYIEKPDGKDTRTATQKRRYIWKQVGKNLECEKPRKLRGWKKERYEDEVSSCINATLAAWRDEMEREYQTPKDAKKTTVDFVREFVESKTVNPRSGEPLAVTTRDNYNNALKLLDRKQLQKPLNETGINDVHAWLMALRKEGKGASITDKAFRLLKSALKSAQKRQLISMNPCDFIGPQEGRPVPPKAKVNALNDEGLARLNTLLDTVGHSQMTDCARMALLCGMRAGEICGLRWKDVDGWRTGNFSELHVRNVIVRSSRGQENKPSPKNGTERAISINGPMADLLTYRLSLMREACKQSDTIMTGDEYVFGTYTGVSGTGFFSPNYLSKVWHQFALANNVIGDKDILCNFHALRHTYATHMLLSGEPVVRVAQVLGHRDPSVTERIYYEYIRHGTDSTQERAAGVMTRKEPKAPVVKFTPTGTEG